MKFPTQTAPLPEAQNSVRRVMLIVLLALLPGTLVAIALLGWGVLINVMLAIIAGYCLKHSCSKFVRAPSAPRFLMAQ